MKLEFQSLELENFKCFTAPVALDLTDRRVGLHFIKGVNKVEPMLGSNGSGKTSLWDAVCWCLYGKTPDGLKNPDMKPWTGSGKTIVMIKLLRDGKDYHVKRTIGGNRLTLNGEDVGQEQIDVDLMTFAVFTNTILLGQGQPLFFDLKPQDKMQLFTDTLDLDRWDARSKAASEEVVVLTTLEIKTDASWNTAKQLIVEHTDGVAKAKKRSKAWEKERNDRIDAVGAEIYTVKNSVERLEIDRDEAKVSYDMAQVEQKAAINKQSKECNRLARARNKYDIEIRDMATATRELSKVQEHLDSLKKGKMCPTCGQPWQLAQMKKHRRELRTREIELIDVIEQEGNSKVSKLLKKQKKIVSGGEKIVEDFQNMVYKVHDRMDKFTMDHAKAEIKLEELERTFEYWNNEENPQADQLKDQSKKLVKQKDNSEELEDTLFRLHKRMDRTRFWVQGFKECRLYAIEEVLDELRLVSNAICPELGLEGWELDYSIESETKAGSVRRGLTVMIKAPAVDNAVRWEAYSGGERQRLRLAGALALSEALLNHAGIETDWEILDEPTQHVSPEGIRDMCEALPSRAERLGRRTFYTDHQAIESSHFASVITVTRKRKGARIDG